MVTVDFDVERLLRERGKEMKKCNECSICGKKEEGNLPDSEPFRHGVCCLTCFEVYVRPLRHDILMGKKAQQKYARTS